MSKLPLGPTLYSKDSVSEQPERFFVSELIREKIFFLYDKEVPYSSQVLHRGQGGSGSMWGHVREDGLMGKGRHTSLKSKHFYTN